MKQLLHFARSLKANTKNALSHFLLRKIEREAAPKKFAWRNRLFKTFPALFAGNPAFELWTKAYAYFITQRSPQIEWLDLKTIPTPKSLPAKKIAIHAHIYYTDLAPELAQMLASFPAPYDLLISTPHPQDQAFLREQFSSLPNLSNLEILIIPNRGRDIGPMLYGFGQRLLSYDHFAHLHTKKSVGTNEIGDAWRHYLWNGLLSNSHEQLFKIFDLLERYGLVYPQKFCMIDVMNCQWGSNLPIAQQLCQNISMAMPTPIASPHPGFIEFPVGTMFWANAQSLKPLLQHTFTVDDFAPEQGQTDHTIMHAIERLITHMALSQNYPIAVLTDPQFRAYYP